MCSTTLKKATLVSCPIGDWWDINDWLNDVEETVKKIHASFSADKK